MMPDDHDGPMGVPLNFLERWAPGNGFMLLGKLDDPTVSGRRLYKRLPGQREACAAARQTDAGRMIHAARACRRENSTPDEGTMTPLF